MAESSTQGRRNKQARGNKLKQRSRVWLHFTLVAAEDGKEKSECKRCGKQYASHGTTNLWEHLERCSGEETADRQDAARPDEPSLDEDEASRDLARMIALHGYDPSVVEDDYFKSFVRRINPGFEVPSRRAIEEMCAGISRDSRLDLYRSYGDRSGKLCVAVGEANTIDTAFVYVTSQLIDHHWNLHRGVEDVYLVSPACEHYHLPLRPLLVVDEDDLVDRIVSDIGYEYVRVARHELFMIAGGMTDHINHLKLKDRMEQELEKKIYSATGMEHVLHSIARCLLSDSEFAVRTFETIEGLEEKLFLEHKDLLTQFGLTKFGLLDNPWEYDERWYSCYCSLEILGQTHSSDSDDCAELLRTLWREIYHAIRRVSDSTRPTANLCLVELLKLREVLQSQSQIESVNIANDISNCFLQRRKGKDVAGVLREAMGRLDNSIKDSYLVWSIPLVLDPRYKLAYIEFIFQRAYVHSEAAGYISEVTRQIKKLYVDYLEYGAGTNSANSDLVTAMAAGSSADPLQQAWDEHCRLREGMATEVNPSYQDAETELDRYLKDRLCPETESFDILKWWKDNSRNYPTMARMARDALAMPTTCTQLSSEQTAHVRRILRGYPRQHLETYLRKRARGRLGKL